jgi:hypothetical protein
MGLQASLAPTTSTMRVTMAVQPDCRDGGRGRPGLIATGQM